MIHQDLLSFFCRKLKERGIRMNIIFSHRHGQEDISGKVRRQTLEDDNVDSALYASLRDAKKKHEQT